MRVSVFLFMLESGFLKAMFGLMESSGMEWNEME
jgi:hypothetical protein